MKTLAELKQENAALEEETILEAPQAEEVEETQEIVEEVETEETEVEAETEEESEETPSEMWMHSEEQDSQGEQAVPVAAHAKMRSKLKATISEKDTEIETLRKEVEQLKSAPQVQTTTKPRPKREDFFEAEDPDEAYLDALSDWKIEQSIAKQQEEQQAATQTKAQQDALLEQSGKVENHYVRAAELASKNGIAPEVYQAADQSVREAVDSVFTGNGDAVTDSIIAMIGDDSEKVMFYLGRNKQKLGNFKDLLAKDQSGIKAAMMLGELKAELTKPLKRKSSAPSPAPELKGDQVTTASERALKKRYDTAHKNGNSQKAFDVKREARKAGIDTRKW